MDPKHPWLRFIIDPNTEGGVGGTTPPDPNANNDDPDDGDNDEQLGDAGKKALNAERNANKALRADLKALKAQVADLTAAATAKADADKTDAEKLTAAQQRAAEAQAKADASQRTLAGLAAGLDLALAKRLTSDDPDELATEIEELKPYAKNTSRTPEPNKNLGNRGDGDTKPVLDSVAAGRDLYRKQHPTK